MVHVSKCTITRILKRNEQPHLQIRILSQFSKFLGVCVQKKWSIGSVNKLSGGNTSQ